MRRYLLCAGVDYHFAGAPFTSFCERRRKQIADAVPRGVDVSFVTFDVRTGTKQTLEIRWSKGKSVRSSRIESLFAPVTRASYGKAEEHRFNDNQPSVMSIMDLYKEIISIGSTDAGSLMEVSIFSHAFLDGPILVNSQDDGWVSQPSTGGGGATETRVRVADSMRDPDDKDGRSAKDFIPPTLSGPNCLAFQRAFDPKGYVWVWGCNFESNFNTLLAQVERHPNYSQNIGDEQTLEFKSLKQHEIDSLSALNFLLGLDLKEVVRTRRARLSFARIKDAVWAGVSASYAFQLALQTQVQAIGALFGTYAEFNQRNPPLMAISSKTKRHLDFHKKHFAARLDPEGRNYGIFDRAFVHQR